MKKKRTFPAVRIAAALLLLSSLFSLTAAASEGAPPVGTSNSYVYDSYDNPQTSTEGYVTDRVLRGTDFGAGDMQNPQDLFVRGDVLYILDSGNSRILRLSSDFSLLAEIRLKDEAGTAIAFPNAVGLFVDTRGSVYVADEENKVVYIADGEGTVRRTIVSPEADVLPDEFDYRPNKVIVDGAGVIYVLSKGTSGGALQFDSSLNFMGFYGSERVVESAQVRLQRLWRKFMTRDQISAMAQYTPTAYVNFDVGGDDFIYTIRDQAELRRGQVRKLNAAGKDILTNGSKTVFGDLTTAKDGTDTLLTDIEVDGEGFITLLDERRGRLFQYDQSSRLMFAFGGKGNQDGTFRSPSSLESMNGLLLVLDREYNTLTVFRPTEFARNVRQAVLLYDDGRFSEAIQPWTEVLRYNANYEMANVGMGKALLKLGDYTQSMEYFRRGNDQEGYSDAFAEYRNGVISAYFPLVMLAIAALVAVPMILSRWAAKRSRNEYLTVIGKYRYPTYCMLHPFKGYGSLKEERKGSLPAALLLVGLFFLINVFARQATGFIFNTNRVDQLNIFVELIKTVGVVLVFTVANWAVSTIIDGEGTFKEVFVFTAYGLTPYILGMIPVILFSNIAIMEEQAFYVMLLTIVQIWTVLSVVMAVKEVQQFSLGKTIGVLLLTLAGIVITFSIVAIVYSMFTQMVSWISTVVNELLLRA